jgi:hypothetical protein
MTDRSFGFIITRHVNSEKTNEYWNNCVSCIQHFYPNKMIVVIDDNSNPDFVKPKREYKDVIIHQSEHPGRGELLPFLYLIKNNCFDNAVILHDSVFFHKRLCFENFIGTNVIPFWHFGADKDDYMNTTRLASRLRNNHELIPKLALNDINILGLRKNKWYGCFGVLAFIKRDFLLQINQKYQLFNLISGVTTKKDRCSLERIFGVIFSMDGRKNKKIISLFGEIHTYQRFGYTYDDYINDLRAKKLPRPVIKVWTGR